MDNEETTRKFTLPKLFLGLLLGFATVGIFILLITFYLNARSTNDFSIKPKVFELSISSPKENIAVSQKEIQVTGRTGKDSVVTISSDSETKTIETRNSLFSTKLTLREGLNVIRFSAFDIKTGESQVTNRQILYLESELINL